MTPAAKSAMKLGIINCAKCKRPVDRVGSFLRNKSKSQFELTVYCHGEEQTSILTDRDLAATRSISVAEAFAGNPSRI